MGNYREVSQPGSAMPFPERCSELHTRPSFGMRRLPALAWERCHFHQQPTDPEMQGGLPHRAGDADPKGIATVNALDAASASDAFPAASRSSARALLNARLKDVLKCHRRVGGAFAVMSLAQRCVF